MSKITRRTVVGTGAVGAAALLTPLSQVRGANDDIRVAVVGLGGRGGAHLGWFDKQKGARVTAGVDPDRGTHRKLEKFKGAKAYTDVRKMLDDDVCDVVVVATSNHWHCLASIWAIEAGRDVYCEKPISHNIWEGRQLVKAARKHNKIVQGGTQQRSDPLQAKLKAFVDEGSLGAMKFVRLNRFGVRGSIGKRDTPLEIDKSKVDYDLWLGPAEDQPIFRNKLQYDWHWDFNTGNGELGNWGPHITDDCRNVAFRDKVSLPKRVVSGGGRFAWNDAGDTPNTHFTYFDTGDVPVVMAVHNLPYSKERRSGDIYRRIKHRGFLVMMFEDGYYAGGRGGGQFYSHDGKMIKKFSGDGGGGHAANFLSAVRSRKREELNGEIEQIHYSSAWCHLGNISYQLGSAYNKDAAMNTLKGNEPWEEMIADFEEHCELNGVDPAKADGKLGPILDIDPAKETFVGDNATPEAKAMLTRKYRKGYAITESA